VIDGQAIVGFDRRDWTTSWRRYIVPSWELLWPTLPTWPLKALRERQRRVCGQSDASGAAERAGLKVGDVIVSLVINHSHCRDLQYLIGKLHVGRAVTVNYIRGRCATQCDLAAI
jgi:hypothetical protein